MNPFVKTILAHVLFFVVLFGVGAGFVLLEADPAITIAAVFAVGAFMKFDDHRIRKARRSAVR